MPLWLSDGCDGPDLPHLVEEALNAARNDSTDPDERDGFARSWSGDTAYVFILRDGATLLGALGVSCQDGSGGARPFSLVQGLLRPALQVLSRELVNQYSIGDLRQDAPPRDGDLELLLDASGPRRQRQRRSRTARCAAASRICSAPPVRCSFRTRRSRSCAPTAR